MEFYKWTFMLWIYKAVWGIACSRLNAFIRAGHHTRAAPEPGASGIQGFQCEDRRMRQGGSEAMAD